jgi:putative flippase GtrA
VAKDILVNYRGFSGVVTVDADGQHLPKDVRAVASSLLENPESLVLGARKFHSEVPLRSQFGNILTRNIFHFLMGKKLQDTQTGLRGIPMAFLIDCLRIKSYRYEFELDMLVQAASRKMQILEVPIETIYIDSNSSSHFNPLLDSFRIYFIFARFLFVSLFTFFVDFVSFTICYSTTKNLLLSVTAGRVVALGVSMVGAKLFVFKSKEDLYSIAPKFISLWLALFGIAYVLIGWLVNTLHFNVYLSRILVDSSLFLGNFLIQRDVIFSEKDE